MSALVKSICSALERVAPLRLAEKWDNVGLLLEAPTPRANARRILLTIDLTTAVTEEALKSPSTSFIVSYHPTIFKPLSSLTLSNPLQASLLRCAAAGISIYSPHTALDSVWGGINDWLGAGIARPAGINREEFGEVKLIGQEFEGGIGGQGGRIVILPKAVSMKEIERRVKDHLKLEHIQVAYPHGQSPETPSIRTISICAGSGGSVLLGTPADVYFTGEMSHHEVLAAVASGHNVVLCGHTNTERGYLPTLAQNLQLQLRTIASETRNADSGSEFSKILSEMEVVVSEEDMHPLRIV
ncbi:NGG1p interacting factor 3 [Panus rudis PR-1116 ss-1]|nr:NGG1p interacting factor 3 [Panus rudis PR-1116 ss-1]